MRGHLLPLGVLNGEAPFYFLGGTTASLKALAILIFVTVLAGILIGAPVWGLRPTRAFRLERTNLPIPGRVKAPVFLVSEMASLANSSKISLAVFLVNANFSARLETNWVLVKGFLAAIINPPWSFFSLVLYIKEKKVMVKIKT